MTPTPPPPAPALDFARIRSTCPAAFAALDKWAETLPANQRTVEWIGEERAMSSSLEGFSVPANLRDLYDFFDGEGVYLVVDTSNYPDGRIFYSRIALSQIVWLSDGMKTRADAEAAAFGAAFARLERTLTTKSEL